MATPPKIFMVGWRCPKCGIVHTQCIRSGHPIRVACPRVFCTFSGLIVEARNITVVVPTAREILSYVSWECGRIRRDALKYYEAGDEDAVEFLMRKIDKIQDTLLGKGDYHEDRYVDDIDHSGRDHSGHGTDVLDVMGRRVHGSEESRQAV